MDITFQSKLIVTFQKYVFNKSMFFSNFKSQDFRTVACSSLPVPWPSEWETSKTLILVTKSFERFDGKVITKYIIYSHHQWKEGSGKYKRLFIKSEVLVSWVSGLLGMEFRLKPAWDELCPLQCSLGRPAQVKLGEIGFEFQQNRLHIEWLRIIKDIANLVHRWFCP